MTDIKLTYQHTPIPHSGQNFSSMDSMTSQAQTIHFENSKEVRKFQR
jgi:hypothetical protein